MTEIPALVSEWKSIVVFPGWSKPEKEDGYMRFSAPLEIGGIVEQGLTFQGGCYRDHPDRHVTFQLCWHTIRGTVPLERLDWKSLQGSHTNRRAGPPTGPASAYLKPTFTPSSSTGLYKSSA